MLQIPQFTSFYYQVTTKRLLQISQDIIHGGKLSITIAPYPWSLLHFKGLLELPGRDTVPICSLFSGPDDLGFPWHSSNLDPTIPSVARELGSSSGAVPVGNGEHHVAPLSKELDKAFLASSY